MKCPRCGGELEEVKNSKGAIRLKCKKNGDDPNCNFWGSGGKKKTTEGAPAPAPKATPAAGSTGSTSTGKPGGSSGKPEPVGDGKRRGVFAFLREPIFPEQD